MAQVLTQKQIDEENEKLYIEQNTPPKFHTPDPLGLEEARKHPKYFNLANKDKLTNEILRIGKQ